MARIVQAREDGDAALERLLSAELLVSVRPVIRCAVFKCLPFAGSLSPEDLEQVAAMAVLRTVDKFDPSRGRQSFGDVAYFRARTACEQYARLHASDVHPSDGAHKGRTAGSVRDAERNTIRIHRMDTPSHFSDGSPGHEELFDELEAALYERSGRDADDETPEAMLLAAESRALVFEAVRQLAPQQRELVSRVFGINRPAQSVRSVAEAWGAPKSRVDRMLARALEVLRELMVTCWVG
ncbi:sigma-70 family RNA polymerase sigma factor [Myxococcus sp. MISCRS1]|uniref:sigma-70 family RNA polymerase sigma factor n=1 Tax=Myxococcus sp. MISCRS1 TaxID=2996786 RepID=UPI00226D8959|nr:sigma-70 family RNA polymerase sigma factor [Myxococcus sp. MISCRS1]MCY0997923.1 sigma-70 family RNA polymerase sigma factor [Myxococcus sp. MISCRS1]